MKAYEFPVQVAEAGRLSLPADLLGELSAGRIVRAIILVGEPSDTSEGKAWADLAAKQFLAGYIEVRPGSSTQAGSTQLR